MADIFCEFCESEDIVMECQICGTMFCEYHSHEADDLDGWACPHCGWVLPEE